MARNECRSSRGRADATSQPTIDGELGDRNHCSVATSLARWLCSVWETMNAIRMVEM